MSSHIDLSRQWLRMALIALLVLSGFSFITNMMLRRSGLKQEAGDRTIPFDLSIEVDYHLRYGTLGQDFTNVTSEADLAATTRRNLFERYRPAEDFFVLVDIRLEPLSLIYKGRIEQRDGSLIAQVNWGDQTYFVREGEAIDQWRIVSIDEDRLVVRHAEGEELALPYLAVTYRKERIAVLYSYSDQKEYSARAGSVVSGYTVSEITDHSVTLSGKTTFTLTKKSEK